MDQMFKHMYNYESKPKISRKSVKKRKNRNEEGSRIESGISAQELEKIIEAQLASALVSVMTQKSM